MQGTIFLTVSALIYTIVTTIIFFLKDKINKVENRIYKRLLVTTILSMTMELLIVFTVNMKGIGTVIQKLFLICLIIWLTMFMVYTFVVTTFNEKEIEESNIKKYKKLYLIFILLNVLICGMIMFLPITFNSIGNAKYTSGPAVNIVFATLGIYVFTMSILVLSHIKKIHKKGYIPIIALIILLILEGIIQKSHPEILLSNFVFGFIGYLMYHTIENPDTKMVEQLERNKKLIEQGNEDKSNFLFRMSQEVKKPIDDIIRVNKIIEDSEDIETMKKCSKYIDYNSRELKSIINNVLDVTKMDTYNIKMIDSTYNVYNIFTELFSKYENVIDKNIEYRYNISKNIPKILYGDPVKIKQVVTTIIENCVKYTKHGFIDINVDSIVKNDVCRLIISIEDSGCGMSVDKVNKLLTVTESLSDEDLIKLDKMNLDINIVSKIVRLLGGQLIIKSEEHVGSEFIITIEQRIKFDDKSSDDKYVKLFSNKKRVLLVDDKQQDLNIISEYLDKYNVDVIKLMYASECIDRINNNQKFDLIIVDDEMRPTTGINLLQQLKENKKFNIPVVILLDENKEAIKEHYVEDGFSDYILKKELNKELDRVIKKFI